MFAGPEISTDRNGFSVCREVECNQDNGGEGEIAHLPGCIGYEGE